MGLLAAVDAASRDSRIAPRAMLCVLRVPLTITFSGTRLRRAASRVSVLPALPHELRTLAHASQAFESLHKLQLKNPACAGFFNCREWDSNPYAFRRGILSPLCIPFHHRGTMIELSL